MQTLPKVLSALLKYEQTPETRVTVPAEAGTKAGQFVDYPAREGKKLVALSDEQNGVVVVQPFNCVIDASQLDLADVQAAASTEGTFEGLQKDGDPYGIMYVGLPKDTPQNGASGASGVAGAGGLSADAPQDGASGASGIAGVGADEADGRVPPEDDPMPPPPPDEVPPKRPEDGETAEAGDGMIESAGAVGAGAVGTGAVGTGAVGGDDGNDDA